MIERSIYDLAYLMTYGKLPPDYQPPPPNYLQDFLEKIAPKRDNTDG